MNSRTFVSLTAVSTERQVEDKASLKDQSNNSKVFGESMGWRFVKEFTIEGYSRSGYYDLSTAFIDIPELGRMAHEIQSGVASMIIVDSFDRLGSLGLALYEWLKSHRVQLRSVQQPTPFYDPTEYEWHKDNGTYKMIVMSLLDQDYRIGKLIRAFTVGTKKRVQDGYYARRLPYGYTTSDGKNATIVPLVAGLLVKFPVWFLAGKSIHQIAKLANETGVTGRTGAAWVASPIINILQNPFYAGKVTYERGSNKTGIYKLHKNIEYVDGKHEPLWSWDVYLRIMAEFEKRSEHHATKHDYNFSGCLTCGACGKRLRVAYDKYKDTRHYWMCPHHVYIRDKQLEKLVADQLIALYSIDAPLPSSALDVAQVTDRELNSLRRRMAKLDEENEAGAYTVDEFVAKRKQYKIREAELLDAERQKQEAEARAGERVRLVQSMREIAQGFPRWLVEHDPSEVRHLLSRTVRIVVNVDKTVLVSRI